MTGFNAYAIYMHIKLHFTTDKYDVRKYAEKTVSPTAYQKSPIRFKFEKLAQKYNAIQLKEFFVANFATGDKYGGMYNGDAEHIFLEWQGRVQGLGYHFKQDLDFLREIGYPLEALWSVGESHPLILRHYLGKHISLETLTILNKLYGFSVVFDEHYKDDIMWKPVSRMLHKYEAFITFNKEDFHKMVEEKFAP